MSAKAPGGKLRGRREENQAVGNQAVRFSRKGRIVGGKKYSENKHPERIYAFPTSTVGFYFKRFDGKVEFFYWIKGHGNCFVWLELFELERLFFK